MFVKNFLLLSSILPCAISAASGNYLLPYTGESTPGYAKHENFIKAVRENNVEAVKQIDCGSVRVRYAGKITSLHVAATIEHFSRQDPTAMIDTIAWHVNNPNRFYSLGCQRVNVNHPAFMLMCTGTPAPATFVKHYLSPVELAARYASRLTLMALARHMPISEIIVRMPEFNTDFELYSIMARAESGMAIYSDGTLSKNKDPYLRLHLRNAIIKHFDTRGMELLHEVKIPLEDTRWENCKTPLEHFREMHPTKMDAIAHLLQPDGYITAVGKRLRNFWAAPEPQPDAPASSASDVPADDVTEV